MSEINDVKSINKRKIDKIREESKKVLIKKINNGYLVQISNLLSLCMFDEEDDIKKNIDEFFFKTIEEALEFVHIHFIKMVIEK